MKSEYKKIGYGAPFSFSTNHGTMANVDFAPQTVPNSYS